MRIDGKRMRRSMVGLALALTAALTVATPQPGFAEGGGDVENADELKAAVAAGASRIEVAGDFALEDLIELPGGADITLGGAGTVTFGKSAGIKVPSGTKLTIDSEDLVLDGGNENAKPGENEQAQGLEDAHTVPMVWSQGELTLKAGTIQNFTGGNPSIGDAYLRITGVNAVYIEGTNSASSFIMRGGTIKRNATTGSSYGGAGVKLAGENALMTMDGGTITENSAQRSDASDGVMGGGVLMFNGGTLTMNGGTVSNNVAGSRGFDQGAMGGGIAGIGLGFRANMVLNGGTVEGNRALSAVGGHGGGVFMHTHATFVANGGSVLDNETTGMGGGLYVDGVCSRDADGNRIASSRFYNTVITGNTATNLGGGLWICPTGYGTISVTKGAAIYGNSAPANADASSAGDDFVVHPHDERDHTVTLADRMLGGGKATWYRDGGLQANKTSSEGLTGPNEIADPDVPRYSASDGADPVTVVDSAEPHALKNVASESAQALAGALGRVVISGNKAKVGGGVATNQMISFGGNETGKDIDISLTVSKSWDASVTEADRREVTVDLKVGDYVIDSAVLNEACGWTHTFENLPAEDTLDGLRYSVVERDADANGYDVSYEAVAPAAGSAEGSKAIKITNRKIVVNPVEVSLMGTKTMKGREFKQGDSFTFQLTAGADAPMPQDSTGGTVTISPASGTSAAVDFGSIRFEKEGTYTYRIRELKGDADGVTYDTAERAVTVTVTRDGRDLVADVSYAVDGSPVDALAWENSYIEPNEEKPTEGDGPELPRTGDAQPPAALLCIAAIAGAAMTASGVAVAARRR